jgi:hypothetical protein
MKSAILAAAAATAAAFTFSASAAFADTANTSIWRPHGPTQTTKKLRPAPTYHRDYDRHAHRPVYRPVYRPGPVQMSAAELAAKRRAAFADGRITFVEKLKLNAAQRRHESLVRSYR